MAEYDPMARLVLEMEALLGDPSRRQAPTQSLPAHVPVPEEPPVKTLQRPPRVLVIDDNKDYRDLVRILLSDNGFKVLEAKDGSEGLALVLDKTPDLVIVDFNMPRINGYEFVQEMKSTMETRAVPIIMFSGAPNRDHIKDLGLDLVDFLDKPVTNAKLLETVQRVFPALPRRPLSSAPRIEPAPPSPQEYSAYSPSGREKSIALPPSRLAAPSAPQAEDFAGVWQEDEALLELIKVEKDERPESDDAQGLEVLSKDSPLITKVNQILLRAIEMGASDVHIEPQEKQVTVRVRIDGTLRNLCTLPASLQPRLCARIKIMANLTITERRLPQDGQFQAQVKGRPVEFRVSTMPSVYGEKMVLRILGQNQLKSDLHQLGMSARDLGCVEKILKSPHGLALITGPTGSGKTTTLYSMISALNTPDVNIMTAEDPIEYRLGGITQSQIRPAIGLSFESVLRAFLRQDPDIMLVGEIRDKETAEIAVKASITGHLVFSTLHTNSAAATIMRLIQMGLAPYLISASVKLVAAQRLVKLLCPACKIPQSLSDEDKRSLTEGEAAALKTVFRPRGCPSCGQAGYAGRSPIFEVMPVNSSLMRQAILSPQGAADQIQELAVKEGMTSLRQAALKAVAAGLTSLHEAYPIVFGD